MRVHNAEFDLARLVRFTASHFAPLAAEREISFVVEAATPIHTRADPEMLGRVLSTLFSNAFKFTPNGGRVRCVLRNEGAHASLIVEDSGAGVAPELREAVFERFRQTDANPAQRFVGSEVGLAIVKEFVELHGGTISLNNGTEGGACFRIELPLVAHTSTELDSLAGALTDTAADIARQTVEALRDNEERYRLVAETASDAIITINEESTILFVNQAAEKIFGYSIEEISGAALTMLMPEYMRHVHRAGINRYLATGQKHISWKSVELPGLHKNGKEIPLELSFGESVRNGKRFFTGIARDITERKRAGQRLAAQYTVTRILAEAATLSDAAPRILQAICESLGWELGILWSVDRDAHVLRCVETWHMPSIGVAEFEAISRQRAFAPGVGLPGRIWASGAPVWIDNVIEDSNFPRTAVAAQEGLHAAFGFPLLLGSVTLGVIEFFSRESQQHDDDLLAMMHTIGSQIGQFIERKRAENELQASEHRYRHLADAMPQIVWTARPDGCVDYYNQRWVEYTGLAAEQTQGGGWQFVLHADDVEQSVRRWNECVRTGENYEIECRLKRVSDGAYRWHLGRALPMRDQDGQVIKWFGTFTEIEDQKRNDEERSQLLMRERTARAKAEEANRAKDEFLAVLSHELRTPLTPIKGWVHMMRRGMLASTDLERGLAVVDKNSEALTRLINDLLDMSAILSGKMNFDRVIVPLGAALSEAVETVRTEASTRSIQIAIEYANWNEPVIVSGDKTRLTQIFWNLLNNAVKFSVDGSTVRVVCESDDAEARIRIEDRGQGISPDFLPHIFERFRQADSSKTRSYGGLGIGLALVKSFVESHGGIVEAASEGEGKGSRFTVRLPRVPVPLTQADETSVEAGRNEEGARVLIVDDERDTLGMLRTAFEVRGYRTTVCESATEVLRIAASASFDAIVSDVGMPQLDGYSLIKRLREFPHLRHVPAVALTGYVTQKDVATASAAGFDAHIAKPVDPAMLIARVEEMIRQNSKEKAL